jgi:carbon storage regulator
MLVLQRRYEETVVIGEAGQTLTEPIVVQVMQLRPTSVRLGIEAPRDIPIHRGEVHAEIRRQTPKTADELMAEAGL